VWVAARSHCYVKLTLSSYDSSGVPIGLGSSSTRITAFGGQAIEHFGTCKLALSHNDHSGLYPFHVVNTTGPAILGLPTCTDMKLVTLNYSLQHASTDNSNQPGNSEAETNLLTQYADCFEGNGCFEGEYNITLNPIVSPVIHPPRHVPEALREPLKKELESLVSQGIIAKVNEPTDWVNSLVCMVPYDYALTQRISTVRSNDHIIARLHLMKSYRS
jgi:hypothetical protein